MALLLTRNVLYILSNKCVTSNHNFEPLIKFQKIISINPFAPLRYTSLRNTHSQCTSTTTSSTSLHSSSLFKPNQYLQKNQEPTKDNDYDYATYKKNLNAKILSLPEVKSLLNNPKFERNRVYPWLNEKTRYHHLTAKTLKGPGMFAVSPLVFFNSQTRELIGFQHIGKDLSGHEGIAHGGLLAVLVDEMFARVVNPCFPEKNSATAYLHINYRAPCPSDAIVKGYAKITNLEGRKAFVEGRIELIKDDGNGNVNNVMVVDANGLFLSIKKLVPT
ncbi:2149_t:CDS:2 [Ambispora leptoticha]|uniref:2149_t:CDS:1 n=1 Tax=Ambispora leptoticha TaxID=144679 RepID=A0A9N8V7A4_9GLOM|nr:2149_t:CDS:2 [Ambispora leptoticha]